MEGQGVLSSPGRRKFCVVSQYWTPDIIGDVSRVKQIVEGLKQLNCDVTVITTQPHYPKGDRRGWKFRPMSAEYEEGVLVFRLGMPELRHSGFGNRLTLYSWFAAASLLPSLVLGRRRVHWVFSQRVFASYPAMVAKLIFRRTVISDVTDVWPEAVVNTGLIRADSLIFKIGKVAARIAYLSSSKITTMTRRMSEFLTADYRINPDKIFVIPYAGKPSRVFGPPAGDSFNILYYGNLGPMYDFDVIVRAAAVLKEEGVRFIVRAEGDLLDSLLQSKDRLGLSNLDFISQSLSEEDLRSLISDASVLLLPMKRQVFPDVSFPGKLVEYVQSGRPTVLLGGGYAAELVTRHEVGLVVPVADHMGLADAIRRLEADSNLRLRLAANATNVRTKEFGGQVFMESLNSLLSRIQ